MCSKSRRLFFFNRSLRSLTEQSEVVRAVAVLLALDLLRVAVVLGVLEPDLVRGDACARLRRNDKELTELRCVGTFGIEVYC